MTSPDPLTGYTKEQHDEWFTWVAATEINVGNARAYNTGDPVPASNVQAHGYDTAGLVVKRTSAAGKTILNVTGKATADEVHAAEVEAQSTKDTTKGGSK